MIVLNYLGVRIVLCLVLGISAAGAWEHHDPVRDSTGRKDTLPEHAAADTILVGPPSDGSGSTASSSALRPNFLERLGQDFVQQASSPFTMNDRQAAYTAAGIGITAGLIMLDGTIDRRVRTIARDNAAIGSNSYLVSGFGSTYGVLTCAAYAGYSMLWNDDEAQHTSMLLAEALITSGVWVRLGKMAFGRERPSASYEFSHDPGGEWHGPSMPVHRHRSGTITRFDAFPSGHTATAFAIATVFARRYSETTYVPVISYSLATMVGVTRMIEHTHWASDVFAGACIGYLCGAQVVSRHDDETAGLDAAEAHETHLHVSLGVLNDAPALQLAIGF